MTQVDTSLEILEELDFDIETWCMYPLPDAHKAQALVVVKCPCCTNQGSIYCCSAHLTNEITRLMCYRCGFSGLLKSFYVRHTSI